MRTAIIGVLVIAAGILAYFAFQQTASASVGTLDIYGGTAELERNGKLIAGQTGTPVLQTDVVHVGVDGRASILLHDGSVVRLEPGTVVFIASDSRFQIQRGTLEANVPQRPAAGFQVETPTIVAAVRGTRFTVSYLNAVSEILVADGSVLAYLIADPANTKVIVAGQILRVRDAFATEDFAAGPVSIEPMETMTKKPLLPVQPRPIRSVQPIPPKLIVDKRKIIRLTLAAEREKVVQNEIVPLHVVAEFSDGAKTDETKNVKWQQEPFLGVIDTAGIFHASLTGTTSIRAQLNDVVSNEVRITVVPQEPVQEQQQEQIFQLQRIQEQGEEKKTLR